MRLAPIFACLVLAGCRAAPASDASAAKPPASKPEVAAPSPVGLVPLPCNGSEPLRPANSGYCRGQRHYVTPQARDAIVAAARAVHRAYPDTVVTFMDASWPSGRKPFPPHLSHGDGRQIDLALFYVTRTGARLAAPPHSRNGYAAFEPRPHGEPDPCPGVWENRKPDPAADRDWRLDDARSKLLARALVQDRRVRRILVEPHLEKRFGLWGDPKARFQGCKAARHDDHLHVDFL